MTGAITRRVERLEAPEKKNPLFSLAEELDRHRRRLGEPPRVDTPEDIARKAERLRELEARAAAGKRLLRAEEFILSSLRHGAAADGTVS